MQLQMKLWLVQKLIAGGERLARRLATRSERERALARLRESVRNLERQQQAQKRRGR